MFVKVSVNYLTENVVNILTVFCSLGFLTFPNDSPTIFIIVVVGSENLFIYDLFMFAM